MSVVRPGKWIVLEGPDGAGKTTQSELLQKTLTGYGVRSIRAREPGGTLLGERLRDLIKDPDLPMTSKAQLFALESARAQMIETLVIPALRCGDWVIMDRYTPSTIVYRPDISQSAIEELHTRFEFPEPDLYIFLLAPHRQLAGRITGGPDRFDNDKNAPFRNEHYLKLAPHFGAHVVYANNPIPLVSVDINNIVFERFYADIKVSSAAK